ncbi:MAG TPA: DNA polymerase II [Syntrophaceae bacterium]|nr:DNA polymerase II [Syntrophaceae bacterium]
MKTSFWLLDINYEMMDGCPQIHLWGLDNRNKRILAIDRSPTPYFYLLLKKGKDVNDVAQAVLKVARSLKDILDVTIVERRYFGKSAKVLKITCKDPDHYSINRLARKLTKIEGVEMALEDDIRFSTQYLLDTGITPCGWYELGGKEVENNLGAQVDSVYLITQPLKPVEITGIPNLTILAFTILWCNQKAIVVSMTTNTGEERELIANDTDDKPVLEGFIRFIREYDPDIIFGYDSNRQWHNLLERAKNLGLTLSIDRMGTEPHTSIHGHISVTGRTNIDLLDFAHELEQVKVKTLSNVAEFLGVKVEGEYIEEMDIPSWWKTKAKRKELLNFAKADASRIIGIGNTMLDYILELSHLVGLPLDYVGRAATGFRVENYLLREARSLGELAPKRVERPYFPYTGGMVMAPKSGIHKDIAVLDFKSLYPNLMILYNLSPDTYVDMKEKISEDQVYIAPELGHRFRKTPPGFYKHILTGLIGARDRIHQKMKSHPVNSFEYRLLDARQRVVKIITNACYGYAGWLGARWYLKPVAEAVAAWGRATISKAQDKAKSLGLEVIYSDTDSLFVKYDSRKIEALTREIEEELGLEIKPDKVYRRIFFTEAKKRYAGLLPDGRLDIVGLEVVRGDWAPVAKDVQERVLEIILKEESVDKALEYVHQFLSDFRKGKVPYKDLVIWKTITKPLEAYKAHAPHVEAARRLIEAGYKLTLGDKIGYVITKGKGKLYQRAIPYQMATYDQIDLGYYISNQILPPATRILEEFGIKEKFS